MSPGAIIRTPSPIETPKMMFIKSQIQELNIVKVTDLSLYYFNDLQFVTSRKNFFKKNVILRTYNLC